MVIHFYSKPRRIRLTLILTKLNEKNILEKAEVSIKNFNDYKKNFVIILFILFKLEIKLWKAVIELYRYNNNVYCIIPCQNSIIILFI